MDAERVYSLLLRVPKGKVTTYAELAKATNHHPRTIGVIMRMNKDLKRIPCYKVVRSDGSVGGYSGGAENKIKLLKREEIEVVNGKIDLKKYLFKF